MTKVASWGVAIMTKMGNMANIVKAASNGENCRRADENFNNITRAAPCKEEKLTEWRI